MSNDEIKIYDELNVDKKDVINCFHQMKLLNGPVRFEQFTYKLTDLLNKYEEILELCNERRLYCLMCLKRLIKFIQYTCRL